MSTTFTYRKGDPKVGRHRVQQAHWSTPRRQISVLVACGILVMAASAFRPPVEPAMTVVIDAGHGGKDPGNLGTGRYKTAEKDITLAVAHKTAASSGRSARAEKPFNRLTRRAAPSRGPLCARISDD